jgi:anti-sigma factor RsiW
MSEDNPHLQDELDLLLDGRLPPEQQPLVEAHLAGCDRCRRTLEALRQVRTAARRHLPQQEVPASLAARVTAALDQADRDAAARARLSRRALVGGGLAAAAVLVLLLLSRGAEDITAAAAEDLVDYRTGMLALELETTDPPALEQYFTDAGLRFTTRVFDFGMMGYRLTGGLAHRLAGRTSALFAYRGADGRNLVCQMFEGRIDELPAAYDERENNGIRFRIYRAGDLTLVFWQEGAVLCVLASDGPAEEAIQLAFAKAVLVSDG